MLAPFAACAVLSRVAGFDEADERLYNLDYMGRDWLAAYAGWASIFRDIAEQVATECPELFPPCSHTPPCGGEG